MLQAGLRGLTGKRIGKMNLGVFSFAVKKKWPRGSWTKRAARDLTDRG